MTELFRWLPDPDADPKRERERLDGHGHTWTERTGDLARWCATVRGEPLTARSTLTVLGGGKRLLTWETRERARAAVIRACRSG